MIKVLFLLFIPSLARAGVVAGLGLHWQNFSFQPEQEEDTPNYYGYGAHGQFGYSIHNIVDLKLIGALTPSQVNEASAFDGDIDFSTYGGEIGVRAAGAAYIGFGYERVVYYTRSHHIHNDPVGRWEGAGPSLSVAGFWPAMKKTYWELGLSLSSAELANNQITSKRQIDMISLNVTYLFMDKK